MPINRLLIYILLLCIALTACAGKNRKVSFSEVCAQESRASVEIEGYLRLPSTNSEYAAPIPNLTSYNLLLVEKQNGTGDFLQTSIDMIRGPMPNRMTELPESYTYADFHVFSNRGVEVSPDERVKITGAVMKNKNSCVLKIEKIETP